MERWTMDELESTDDITFAICILNQRKNGLNPYSPLSMKLSRAVRVLEDIKAEKERFIARISLQHTEPGAEKESEG